MNELYTKLDDFKKLCIHDTVPNLEVNNDIDYCYKCAVSDINWGCKDCPTIRLKHQEFIILKKVVAKLVRLLYIKIMKSY